MPARSKEKSTKKQIVGEFRRRTLESDVLLVACQTIGLIAGQVLLSSWIKRVKHWAECTKWASLV